MINKTRYALVGAFVLTLSAAFIWGVLWISAGGPPQQFTQYVAYMTESVSGLNVDSPLRFRGVDVGSVKQISIDLENPQRIRLLLQVRQGVPITEDTVATLEYQGLTGIATINLTGGQAGSPPIEPTPGEDYPVIPTSPSLFVRLDSSLSDLLGNLIDTSANINALLNEENRINLSRSIESASIVTGNLAEQSDQITDIVANLNATLENLGRASAGLPQLIEQFAQSADAVTGVAKQVQDIGEKLRNASAGIENTVNTSGDDLIYFTGTTLPDIADIVSELRISAENLRLTTESLAQNPSVLIYGSTPPERGPGE